MGGKVKYSIIHETLTGENGICAYEEASGYTAAVMPVQKALRETEALVAKLNDRQVEIARFVEMAVFADLLEEDFL